MNHVYRVVWNEALGSFVAVAEHETAHGKSRPGQAARRRVMRPVRECFVAALSSLGGAVALVLLLATGQAWAEPRGGQVTAGSAGIQQTGSTTVITQTTPKVAIQWQRFDIERGETVRFDQPSAASIALNRVLGTDGSRILGQLQANGQVFLINPNGILFGRGAQVDVGGLVASTLNLTDDDFLAGRYLFSGNGGSVRNDGRLNTVGGGSIALLGSQVINTGEITADRGSVALAAGSRMTLDFGGDGLLKLSVDEGTLNALVDNGGLVRADGGSVLMTARAADALRATVVNNTGIVQARTLENKAGVIKLLGGLDEATGGTVTVNGTLDASAPSGGDGGFIEASAYNVRVLDGTQATTLAPFGRTGEFLVDPSDFIISDDALPSSGSGIGNLTLQGLLADGNFTAATTNAGAAAGNLIVNGAVTWTTANTLTLQSRFGAGGIQINQPLRFANGRLALDATGTITASAAVTGNRFSLISGTWRQVGGSLPTFSAASFELQSTGTFIRALGGDGTLGNPYRLTDVYGLQGMGSAGMRNQNYRLANDIGASGTATWNLGAGWVPVGDATTAFTGTLDGAGFTVSGLTIARATFDNVGLFGAMNTGGVLQNLNLANVSINGRNNVGGAVGTASGSSAIDRVSVSGSVSGQSVVGGVVGLFSGGTLNGAANAAAVTTRSTLAGGLSGNVGAGATVSRSYNTGPVNGSDSSIGGLVGSLSGVIETSFNTGEVRATGGFKVAIGGLAGQMAASGRITDAYNTGAVVTTGSIGVGGAVGIVGATATLERVYSTGTVTGQFSVGGLVGLNNNSASTFADSFWDTTSSGLLVSAAGTGKTTAELKTLSTFSGAGWTTIDDAGGSGRTWRIYDGNTLPLLRNFMTGLVLTPAYDGSGSVLTNVASISLPVGTDAARVLGNSSSTTLTLRGGAAGGYTAEVDAGGFYSVQLGYDIARLATRRVLTPGSLVNNITLPNGVAWTNGTLAIDTPGTITAAGAIAGGAGSIFDLRAGAWRQNGALASFAVNDFRLNGGSFLRVLGGNGLAGNPFRVADVYGLQGIGSSSALLGAAYSLSNNIDASGTVSWNAGLGWKPVGDNVTPFSGDLNGAGFTVSGLTIARPLQNGIGLIGTMTGTVRNLTLANAAINGQNNVGGVAGNGLGASSITGVSVSGSVIGSDSVGGVVGSAEGIVSLSTNAAAVTSRGNFAGGIAGIINATAQVSTSYNTGTVTARGGAGGIAGSIGGRLDASFNTGEVRASGGGANIIFGGLAGQVTDGGRVRDAYSTGAVVGGTANNVGGAFGSVAATATLNRIYSTGRVSGSNTRVGGLLGVVAGGGALALTDSFWDTETSGRATSAAGVGKTTAELKTLATFTSAGWDMDDAGGTGKFWRIYGGNTTPLLRSFMTGLTLTPDYDGSGTLLANIGSIGLPAGANAGLVLGTATSNTLTLRAGVAGSYLAEADATGLYSVQLGYDLPRTASRTISTPGSLAGNITLPNGVAWTNGTLAIDTPFSVDATGAIAGGAGSIFDLRSGVWRQVAVALPGFVVNDFRVSGGNFIRALGGTGIGLPYRLTDVYGLQGMGGSGLLSRTYELANAIDASGTANWNAGLGWKPVGDSANAFIGALDGAGFTVSGLRIARPGTAVVGLIGSLAGTGRVANLTLGGLSVSGSTEVGGVVGRVTGGTATVEGVTVSGSVSGTGAVGGLVGSLNGVLSRGVNAATVTSSGNFAGGVAGLIDGSVSSSYNTGTVSGQANVGGVAGLVTGVLETSFNTGEVRGSGGGLNANIGGLAGQATGTVRDAYSTGAVVGGTAAAVGGGIGVATNTAVLDRLYSTGAVSTSGVAVGGLVGGVFGGVVVSANSFWDTTTSGQASSAVGVGKTTAELKTLATFTGAGWTNIDDAGGTGKTWRIYGGNTTPLLRSFMTGLTVTPAYDGTSTARTNIGDYALPVGTDASKVLGSVTVNRLTLSGAGVGTYTAAIDPTGLYSTQLGYDISAGTRTLADGGGVAAGDIRLTNNLVWTNGTLAFDTPGFISMSGTVAGGAGSIFDLRAGSWRQVAGFLPGFAVRDFRLSGGSFLRVLTGTGSGANPYRVEDVYGLQGMGSSDLLGRAFQLFKDIDASGTANWNNGLGWKPVGDSATPFTGTLNGAGFTVSGLTIARPTALAVGLFGGLGGNGRLQNLTLANVSINGQINVGAGAGAIGPTATIDRLRVSGSVSGSAGVGGVAGRVDGTVSGGVNSASVTGSSSLVGGIAGSLNASGKVSGSYNTGVVTGPGGVGGVAGGVTGLLETSFNAGEVRASSGATLNIGGLAGVASGTATVRDAYSTGAVTGGTAANVGGAIGSLTNSVTVNRIYSTGAVSGSSTTVGGLVGAAPGTPASTDSFWDTASSGQATSAWGIGKTTAELKTLSTFTSAGWTNIDDAGGTANTWRIYGGSTTPLLRSFMTGLTVTPAYDGSGTPMTNIGDYALPLGTDASKVLGSVTANRLTLSGAAAGGYTAAIDATGLYSTQLGFDISVGTRNIATAGSLANDITLPNGVAWTNGTLAIDTTGNISATGAIAGGAGSIFDLRAGSWRQVAGFLPGFAVRDFRLSGGSFLRVLIGTGSGVNPYRVEDVYGLQGMGSSDLLGRAFQLSKDIDASGTANWNNGLGWKPVGDSATPFTGTLNGAGLTVSGLTIARPAQNEVGLIGVMTGAVRNLTLSNVSVNGQTFVGAAVGNGLGTSSVTGVSVGGSVSGNDVVGGVVGRTVGSVSLSTNAAAVTSRTNFAGGIAGWINGTGQVSSSYNTGAVTGGGAVGGIAGEVDGLLETSFNAGEVRANGGGANRSIGGLAGQATATGTVRDAYSTGAVVGGTAVGVGGGIGIVRIGAVLDRLYVTGAVSGVGNSGFGSIGGLVGAISGGSTVSTNSFWDTTTTGQARSLVGVGKTSAELKTLATFTDAGWTNIDDAGGTANTWRIYGGNTTPLLRSFMTGLTLSTAYDGTGAPLTNVGSTSLPAGIDGSLVLGTQTGNTLTLSSTVAGSYTATADTTGLYSTQLGYDILGASRAIVTAGSAAGDLTLPNGVSWANGTLVIDTTGNINAPGIIAGGAGSIFDLRAGTWRQVSGALPGFAVNDFRLSGGSFIRALGGDGTALTPYQLTDVYGLQGMGSSGMVGLHHVLANNIDASGTANWNAGLGWKPVGEDATPFTGTLNGNGLTVSGLTIARPTTARVALIGTMLGTGRLANLSLSGVSVSGRNEVGGAVGRANTGTIERVRVSGSVSGTTSVGGVVGIMGGAVSGAINEASVTASGLFVGGIAGDLRGQMSNSYNTGAVTGGAAVGGIAGSVEGRLETSFNAGEVRGNGGGGNLYIGGLTGQAIGKATVSDAYSTGAVVGGTASGVGGAIGSVESPGVTLSRIYSSGAVSGGSLTGGLVGELRAGPLVVTNSFWDTTTSGQAGSAVGVGKTTAELKTLSTFTSAGWTNIDDAGGTANTWRIYGGNTTPLLRSFMTGLDLSAATASRSYDGTTATLNATLPGGGGVLGSGASGKNAGSYQTGYFSNQLGYDITQAVLTIVPAVVGLSGSRVYDAGTGVSGAVLTATGTVAGETLTVTGLGSVATKDVGAAKPVTLGTLALGNGTGGSAGLASNYTLVGGSYTLGITAKPVSVVGLTAQNKVYDATRSVTLNTGGASADGLITGDAVSFNAAAVTGSFVTKDVGTGKAVTLNPTALSGAAAGNYILTPPSGLTADISAKPVTITGITAQNKVYDATLAATLNTGGATADGLIVGDAVSLNAAAATGSFATKDVGTAKAVTVTGAALTGASAGNYALTQPSGLSADITAKPVTVSGLTARNKVYDATLAATLNTGAATADGLITGDAVSLNAAAATGSFATKDVGTGKAVTVTGTALTGASAGNYTLTQPTGLSADITAKPVTVTGITAQNKVYDATLAATLDTSAASADGLIGGDAVSFDVGKASGSFATKDVGTGKAVTVSGTTLTGASAANYTLTQPTGVTADITAKAVTVSGLTAQSKVYDATVAATLNTGGATADGLIVGDAVSFNAAAVTGSFATKDVGIGKAVTLDPTALSGTSAGNYILTLPSALTADITAKPVTVTGITAQNKVYDATLAATLNTGTASADGLIAGDAVSFNAAAATGSFATKDVGTAKAVTVTGAALTGASAGNYTLTQPGGLSADITAKPVTVTGITARNKVYDATLAATLNTGAATADGLITGDAVSFNAAAATGSFATKDVGSGKVVTVTGTALSGASAGNYTLTQPTGLTADITPKPVTVSGITAQNKVYDATLAATLNTGGASADGLITGDAVSFNAAAATGSFATKDVGTAKTVTLTGTALSGASAGNYILTQPSGLTADITAKPVTVTGITAQNKVYDATLAATLNTGGATADGLIVGDAVSFNAAGATGSFATKDVGTGKTVTINGTALSGASAGNYTLTQPAGLTADITAKPVTVTGITAQNKVYDATLAATLNTGTASADGLIAGDAVSFNAAAATGSFATKDVGTGKAVTVTGAALTGASAGNYTLTQPTGLSADITAKPATVTGITARNKVYDATLAATLNTGAASADGLITGDAVSFNAAAATGSFATKDVGTGKAVTVSGTSLSGASAGNYTLTQPTGLTADITPKPVTVSGITAQNKVYDATLAATLNTGGASADGLITGDAVSFNAAAATGSFATKDVGTGKPVTIGGTILSGASAGNYTLTQPTGLTADITPKPVTVTGVTARNKVYDATVAATLDLGAATGSGLIAGDDVRFDPVGVTARFADKNVGVGKPVTVVGGLLSGSAAGNYLLTPPTGLSADITARPVTVVGLNASGKSYDGTTAALLNLRGVRADGLIGSDDVRFDASAASGTYANKNVGFAIPITVNGLRLDGVDAGNYRLISPALASEINPALLTAVAADVVKLFGSGDPLLGYRLIGEVGGDVAADFVRGQLVRDPGESAGEYAIRTGTLTANNPNYLLVVTPATLRILPLVIAGGTPPTTSTPPTTGTPARPEAGVPTPMAALPEGLPVPLRDLAPTDARPRPVPPPESLAPLLRIRDGGVNMPLAMLDR